MENRKIQGSNSARRQPRGTIVTKQISGCGVTCCISRVCFVAAAASGRLVPAVGAVMRPEEVGFTHQAGGKFLSPSGDSR